MANRFWVGGSGTWDSSSTTNWSATSGGAGGASAPTDVDDVFFNASSGSPVVTITSSAVCRNWSHTIGTAAFSMFFSAPVVYGSVTWWTGTIVTDGVFINFGASSGSHTVNLAGKNMDPGGLLGGGILSFGLFGGASTATWTLAGAFNFGQASNSRMEVFAGTVNTNGVAITNLNRMIVSSSSGTVSTLTLGASTVGTSLVPVSNFDVYASGGSGSTTTLNLGTSSIFASSVTISDNVAAGYASQALTVTSSAGQAFNTGTASPGIFSCSSGSQTVLRNITAYPVVNLTSYIGTLSAGVVSQVVLDGECLFSTGPSFLGSEVVSLTSITQTAPVDRNCTIQINCGFSCGAITQNTSGSGGSLIEEGGSSTGALTITGTTTTQNLNLNGSGVGSLAGIILLNNPSDNSQITFSRGAATTTGTINGNEIIHSGDFNLTTGAITSRASFVDLARLTVANSFGGVVTIASLNVGAGGTRWDLSINGSFATFNCGTAALRLLNGAGSPALNFTGAVTIADDAVSGSPAGEMTLFGFNNAAFTSLTQTGTAFSGDNLVANCGLLSFSGAVIMPVAFGFQLTNTGFSYPNAALSVSRFRMIDNLAPRTLTLASGASMTVSSILEVPSDVAVTATGTTITLAHNNDTSTEVLFEHGGQTFGALVATGTNIRIKGPDSFSSVGLTTFTRTGAANNFSQLRLEDSGVTCSGALTLQGNSATNRLFVFGTNDNFQATISAATRTLTNVDFRNIAAAGGIVPWALGTSVGNCQNNTNITFTPSVTRYAVASGAWNTTAVWSATSGGAGGSSVPLPQDDVQFTSGSGAINVTTSTVRALCRDLFIANFTGTLVLDRSTATSGVANLVELYGDASIAAGTNISTGAGTSLITRKFGAGTFLNASSVAAVRLISSNSESLSVPLTSGVLSGFVANNATTDFNGNGNIGVVSDSLGTGSEDVFNFSSPAYPGYPPRVNLGSSSLTAASIYSIADFDGGTSSVILDVIGSGSLHAWGGYLNNLAIQNSAANFHVLNFALPFFANTNTISGTFTTAPSTLPATIVGAFRLTSNGTFTDVGTSSVAAFFGSSTNTMTITNNTTRSLETQFAFFFRTSTLGTKALPRLVAFGAANLGQNTNILFPTTVKIAAFSGYTGSWDVPGDFGGSYYVVAVGAGGQAGLGNMIGRTAFGGGGGGAQAFIFNTSSIARNQTVWIRAAGTTAKKQSVGAGSNGVSSYFNFSSNSLPANVSQGVLAAGGLGSSTFTGALGGSTVDSVGQVLYAGGIGGSSFSSDRIYGGGGGGAAANQNTGLNGGSPVFVSGNGTPVSGGGGGGLGTVGGNGTTIKGGDGGQSAFGSFAVGTSSSRTPVAAAPDGALGGGGGAGGGSAFNITQPSQSYTRAIGSSAVTLSVTGGFTNGEIANFVWTRTTGTYSRTGTLVTLTFASHGLTTGQSVFLDFTSGAAVDGTYVVTVISTSQFRVTTAASGSTSGNFAFGSLIPSGNYTCTVINPTTISVETGSTQYQKGTVVITQPATAGGSNGGNGADGITYTYDFLNGVPVTGSIGPGGGGGGGGAVENFPPATFAGGDGGNGGIGGGGGAGGAAGFGLQFAGAEGDGGGGGAGLVLFVYGVGAEVSNGQLIG